jgi:hypothetical protein
MCEYSWRVPEMPVGSTETTYTARCTLDTGDLFGLLETEMEIPVKQPKSE